MWSRQPLHACPRTLPRGLHVHAVCAHRRCWFFIAVLCSKSGVTYAKGLGLNGRRVHNLTHTHKQSAVLPVVIASQQHLTSVSIPQSVCTTVRCCWGMQAAQQGLPGNSAAAHALRNGHSRGATAPGAQRQQSLGGPLPDSSVPGVGLDWGSTLAAADRSASGSLGLPPGLPPTSAVARASSQFLYTSPLVSGYGSAGGASRPPSGRLPDNPSFGVVGGPCSAGVPSAPRHCHRRSMDLLACQARCRPPQVVPVQLDPVQVQPAELASRSECSLFCNGRLWQHHHAVAGVRRHQLPRLPLSATIGLIGKGTMPR